MTPTMLCVALATAGPAFGQDPPAATPPLEETAAPDEAGSFMGPYLQPLLTRYGHTFPKPVFTARYYYFHDVELQEVDQFEGFTVDLDLTIPIWKKFQLRLYAPIYTEGEARWTDAGQPPETVDIDGYGGTFDFPSINAEWQALNEKDSALNLLVWAGYGVALESLDTNVDDVYNHRGRSVMGGVRLDREIHPNLRLIGNVGTTYYYESDDLNPATDEDDTFFRFQISGAAVWQVWERGPAPVLELVYTGDLDSYHSINVIPEILWPVCAHAVLKAGALIGLTEDGEDIGAQVQAQVNF